MKNRLNFPIRKSRVIIMLIAASLIAATPSLFASNILFVVNTVLDPATPANAHDQEVVAHLVALGHTVTLADDTTVTPAEVAGQDLILISSSTGSGEAGLQNISLNVLKTGRQSVISYEPGVYDELGLQTATTFGNAGGHISLGIVTASHPLAAGKTGVISVVEPDTTATFSYTPAPPFTLGTDAIIIATNATVDVGRISTWAHERGTRLADNSTVTGGRKVALFFNATTAPGVYNTNAYALFDAAVAWALEPAPVLPIIASFKSPTGTGAFPNAPLTVELEDGTAQVVQNSISLLLNDAPVSNPTITRNGAITRVTSQPSSLFASNSTNKLRVVYSDNAAPSKTFTNELTFVVAPYATLSADIAYPISAADASAPGFKARIVQANTASGTLANSEARAEAQLAGTLIDPGTGSPFVNEANLVGADASGFFIDADVINWNQNANGVGAELGNFRAPNFPDEPIPGIPGVDGVNTDNIAAEILTYLELQPGVYNLGVNSDDGFVVSAGRDARDTAHTVLGRFDGGRGAADTTFSFVAPVAGLYSVRVLYYEGNNDANVEFFSINPSTGEKILVNNRTNALGIKAWRQLTVPTSPYLASFSPAAGSVGVAVTNALEFNFINGGAIVNTNSIQVRLNNQLVPVTLAEATANGFRIVADPAGDLLSFTPYTVQLIYADNSAQPRSVTNEFSFTTIRKPIQQGPDGLAVVEAEQFSLNTPQGQHQWIFAPTPAGFSGTGEMYASPDAPGAVIETAAGKTTAPRLDFQINFVKTGTHYFWFRGSDGGGNSLNAGLDGDDPNGTLANLDNGCCGTRLVPNGTSYVWVGGRAGVPAQFDIAEAGVHTVNVWMREDGQLIDKILVTTDPNFVPTGAGPDQSPRVGQAAPTITITSPSNNATLQPGNISLTVNAADERVVQKVEFFESGTKIGESTTAPFTFVWNGNTNGIFVFTAKATDDEGFSTISAPVTVTIGTAPKQVAFIKSAAGSASDTALMARLRGQGFQVREIIAPNSTVADAAGKDLLVISSTVGSGDVVKFAPVAVPTVIWESAAWDDFGFDANNIAGATLTGQTQIQIANAAHPLAAGLPAGPVTVYSAGSDVSALAVDDTIVAGGTVIATTTEAAPRPLLWGFETGADLNPARLATAPARRVGFFLGNNSFVNANAAGQSLFDAAVNWAMNIQSRPQITLARQGADVVINWTGGGTIEWTDSLSGTPTWTPITTQNSTYTEPATQAARFFRIRR